MSGAGPLDVEALLARLATVVNDAGAVAVGSARIARAPGRVNLIGEHTDYNDGYVLPAAIDLETWIAFQPAPDRRVELTLAATGEQDGFDLDAVGGRRGTWIDYVAGVAVELAAAGVPLGGLRGVVAGTLPLSAGLSSSAALELAAAWALLAAGDPDSARSDPDPMTLARLAQRAENDYVGVACGLMDQFASASGRPGEALLLDCRSLAWRGVPLPLQDHALVVCHSGSERRLEASAYNERRRQCEAAVEAMQARHPEVRSLRDVDLGMLDAAGRPSSTPLPHVAPDTSSRRTRASWRRSRPWKPAISRRSAGCGPRVTRPSATCTRSARRSSMPSSRSPSVSTASWPPG